MAGVLVALGVELARVDLNAEVFLRGMMTWTGDSEQVKRNPGGAMGKRGFEMGDRTGESPTVNAMGIVAIPSSVSFLINVSVDASKARRACNRESYEEL